MRDENTKPHQPHIQKSAFNAIFDIHGVSTVNLIANAGILSSERRDAIGQDLGGQEFAAANQNRPFQMFFFIEKIPSGFVASASISCARRLSSIPSSVSVML